MASLELTKEIVEGLEPGERDAYAWDTAQPRFGLRVTPAGARIYLVQYRPKTAPGQPLRTRRIIIGRHGQPWTVQKARGEAKLILASVDLGNDPFADREEERAARRHAEEARNAEALASELRARDTFEKVAERYIDLVLSGKKSGEESARLLRRDPIPAWQDRHIGDIRRADVADLMDGIAKRSPAVARSTFASLRGLFGWCEARDLIAVSPGQRGTAPPRPEARDRVLSDDELRAVWKACGDLGHPFGPIIRLLMLTGQRRAEAAGMAWTELDLDGNVWRIPRERTKNGKAHEIDLSPQAVALIKEAPNVGPLLFPARIAPKRKASAASRPDVMPVRGFSATKRTLDALILESRRKVSPDAEPLAPWRLHDLRRTAATGMAGMNFAPHVVERVLNHVSGAQGGLVGVYQRHEYRPERKAALMAWGEHVAAVVEGRKPLPSNVRRLRA